MKNKALLVGINQYPDPRTFAKKPSTIRTFRSSDSKSEAPKRKARV